VKYLYQLAPSQLVEIIIEQAKAIEQLKSKVVKLEKKNTRTKSQQRFRQYNIIRTSIGEPPQKNREQARSSTIPSPNTKTATRRATRTSGKNEKRV
jgi:transposase